MRRRDDGVGGHDRDRAVGVGDDGEGDRPQQDPLEATAGRCTDDDPGGVLGQPHECGRRRAPGDGDGDVVDVVASRPGPRGGPVEDAVRPLVEVLGQARRPRDQGLVGRQLDLRVDDRHQAQRRPEPGGLVGCPVDDRLVGGRPVDGDDHCSAHAEDLVSGCA